MSQFLEHFVASRPQKGINRHKSGDNAASRPQQASKQAQGARGGLKTRKRAEKGGKEHKLALMRPREGLCGPRRP